MPRPQRHLYLSRPQPPAHLGGERPADAAGGRHQELHQHLRADPHHLDGRPPASFRIRSAHLHGILHRRVAGRHPDRQDHPHQAGLRPAQRAGAKRPGHHGRALHPARQHSHPRERGHRSRLHDRTSDQVRGLSAGRARPGILAVALRAGGRDHQPQEDRRAALLARRESVPHGVLGSLPCFRTGRPRRRGDHVSGIPGQAESAGRSAPRLRAAIARLPNLRE